MTDRHFSSAEPFRKGERVRYVPTHARGDIKHKDCEDGVVSSIGRTGTVFVKYDCLLGTAITGDEPWAAKGTRPEELVRI